MSSSSDRCSTFALPMQELESQALDVGEDVKINPASVIKSLHKIVAEHKDIVKIVMQLNSIVATIKPDVQELLDHFSIYSELWETVSTLETTDFFIVGGVHSMWFFPLNTLSLFRFFPGACCQGQRVHGDQTHHV